MPGTGRVGFFFGLSAISMILWGVLAPPAARGDDAVDLPGAVSRALRKSPAVAVAGFEWEAAKRGADIALGRYLPTLTFEEKFLRTSVPAEAFGVKINRRKLAASDFADVDNFNNPAPINDFLATFTLEQPLFVPAVYLGHRMAGREAEAKGLEARRAKEDTVYRVLSSWLDVLTAKENVRVAGRGLEDAREHRRVAEAAERAGAGLASDVLRARVFLASAEGAMVTAENRLELARKGLALAMGEPGGTSVDATGTVPPFPDIGSMEDRIAAARVNRPDLRSLSLRAANAGANVTLQKSGYLPTVGATGAYQVDAQDGPFSVDNRSWKVGVGLAWNLFDGLRREAAVAKAAAESGKAREYYRGASDVVAFEVTRAYLSVGEAEKRAEIARASLAAAEEGTRLIKARYENQLARMVDLLDAQAALNTARADLARAENDVRQSRAGLEHASGLLLSWSAPEAKEKGK